MEVKSLDCEMRDDIAMMSDDEAREFVNRSINRNLEGHEMWANQNSDAQKVAIDLGLYETPQVIGKEDFDKYVSENDSPVVYRGVKDIESMSGENMQYQKMYDTQKPYFGNGIFGDGLYFSDNVNTANSYAGRTPAIKCAVRSDAKIIDTNDNKLLEAKQRFGTKDNSIAAMCAGYDVMVKNKGTEKYYIVLNRAALIAQDPVDDIATVALIASKRNKAK